MVWRTRLDTTTNWAVTSSTAIITIAFSNAGVPHLIFFFNLAIVWIMLWIEARRYRFYDAFRARVRMLEAHFLVPMVMENRHLLQGEWKKLVCEDLILPSFKIGTLEAVGRRFEANLAFIFILIMIAWVMKIYLHATEPIDSVSSSIAPCASGTSPPGWSRSFRHTRHRDWDLGLCRTENFRRNWVRAIARSGEFEFVKTAPVPPAARAAFISRVCVRSSRDRGTRRLPSDREQTHESLVPNLLEEAYEVADAIRTTTARICGKNWATSSSSGVARTNRERDGRHSQKKRHGKSKARRRHPHVFDGSEARDTGAV
jgi:NTP pyrophosphatase (non-canonical NTP hydrolase)